MSITRMVPVRRLETLEEVRDHMSAPMARVAGYQSSVAIGHDATGKVIIVRMDRRGGWPTWAAGAIGNIPDAGGVHDDLSKHRDRTVFDRAGFTLPLLLTPALAGEVRS